jgi:hypothetical protein
METASPIASSLPPRVTGIRVSRRILFLTAAIIGFLLWIGLPLLITACRGFLSDEFFQLSSKTELTQAESMRLDTIVTELDRKPPRSFFPICGLLIIGTFGIIEGIHWRSWKIFAWSAITGPLLGLAFGWIAGELAILLRSAMGRQAMNNIIFDITMHSAMLGILGGGTGVAVGIAARCWLTAVSTSIGGLLGGFLCSSFFVFINSTMYPNLLLSYPIPGILLESPEDFFCIGLWALSVPLTVAIGLSVSKWHPKTH